MEKTDGLFNKLKVNGNVLEYYFDTWENFNIYFLKMLVKKENFVWRGHRKDWWSLESTFSRTRNKDLILGEVLGELKDHLKVFKMNCRGQDTTLDISKSESSILKILKNKIEEYDNTFSEMKKALEKLIYDKESTSSTFKNILSDNFFETFAPLKTNDTFNFDDTFSFYKEPIFLRKNNNEIYKKIDDLNLQSENEWWAIGQHFGLNTPLLDWTYSMYIAAYFAFIDYDESDKKNQNRVLIALDKSRVNEINSTLDSEDKMTVIDSYSYNNPRLLNQKGIFTKGPIMSSVEDWVNENKLDSLIYKFYIPENERKKVLIHLERMNIHPGTIFPDLTGIAKYTNLKNNIENY